MEKNDDESLISTTEYSNDYSAYLKYLKRNPLPKPSEGQRNWLDLELGFFLHFGVNTYADLEWSDGTLEPRIFNPVDLDCDQWVQVAKEMGAKYMILTAKHHDGFCLWPTETTDYSVKNSPWKGGMGDVVGEFIEACKNGSIAHGLYLSPWDRHEPCYDDKEAYDVFYKQQLTELCTWYDTKFVELWFDGAGSAGREYNWRDIMGVCKKYQPQAMIFNMGEPDIRWAGNENGLAPYPLWNVVRKENYSGLKEAKADFIWLPAECDVPIRYHTWFYNSKNEIMVSPLEELMKIYLYSIGRGANLLLNIAPGRNGVIPEADRKPAKLLGDTVRELFSGPIATSSGNGSIIDLEFQSKDKKLLNFLVIEEDIKHGQRVREYEVKYKKGDKWVSFIKGTSIGHKKIDICNSIKTNKLRLQIEDSYQEPVIKSFKAFYSEKMEGFREYIEDNYI